MKFSGIVLAAALVVGAGSAAQAQQWQLREFYTDPGWHHFYEHVQNLDQRIVDEVGAGQLTPRDAWQLQKELDDAYWWGLYQHDHPNAPVTYGVAGHVHHVHVVLNYPWME